MKRLASMRLDHGPYPPAQIIHLGKNMYFLAHCYLIMVFNFNYEKEQPIEIVKEIKTSYEIRRVNLFGNEIVVFQEKYTQRM